MISLDAGLLDAGTMSWGLTLARIARGDLSSERFAYQVQERPLLPAMLGQLGLDHAREHRPDVILLDLHLPDLGGDEVLSQLRADEKTRDIPWSFSALCQAGGKPSLCSPTERGAYLTKPIGVGAARGGRRVRGDPV